MTAKIAADLAVAAVQLLFADVCLARLRRQI